MAALDSFQLELDVDHSAEPRSRRPELLVGEKTGPQVWRKSFPGMLDVSNVLDMSSEEAGKPCFSQRIPDTIQTIKYTSTYMYMYYCCYVRPFIPYL